MSTHSMPAGFVEVTREEFFATVGKLNVHPRPIAPYPYCSEWRLDGGAGRMLGWSHEDRYAVPGGAK